MKRYYVEAHSLPGYKTKRAIEIETMSAANLDNLRRNLIEKYHDGWNITINHPSKKKGSLELGKEYGVLKIAMFDREYSWWVYDGNKAKISFVDPKTGKLRRL